jgi:preprotein translocase subunit SecG
METILLTLLLVASVFQIVLVLLQRGRGGGVAGAFGQSGGHGVLGTRAGDMLTVITIISSVIWVSLACATGWWLRG